LIICLKRGLGLESCLVSNVVGEPVQPLIKSFPRCGTGALDVPEKRKKKQSAHETHTYIFKKHVLNMETI